MYVYRTRSRRSAHNAHYSAARFVVFLFTKLLSCVVCVTCFSCYKAFTILLRSLPHMYPGYVGAFVAIKGPPPPKSALPLVQTLTSPYLSGPCAFYCNQAALYTELLVHNIYIYIYIHTYTYIYIYI